MKLRYLLGRMNQNAAATEIDEAVELVNLWNEEQVLRGCPLLGVGK